MGKCPKCSSETELALCENPETGDQRELNACTNPDCSYRGQPCEVYSRVCGYLRPVAQWNSGKQEEFEQRETYSVEV